MGINRRMRVREVRSSCEWAQMIMRLSCVPLIVSAASAQTANTPQVPGDVQIESSRVYIHVDKTGLGHEHGVVGMLKEGHIELGVDANAGWLVFDMPTFVADVPYARKYVGVAGETSASTQREVTQNMLGPDVLDVKKYPTAVFKVSSTVKAAEPSRSGLPVYQFVGQLTLHGVVRPVTFAAEVETRGRLHRIRGQFVMRQSQFGIPPLRKALGAIGVADDLVVHGDVLVVAAAK